MRAHKGMRPHDIIILLKLGHTKDKRQLSLSQELFMSQSEISDSLHRSQIGGLIDETKQFVFRNNLLEFLTSGLKYVFPAVPGKVTRGIPTGHSAFPLNTEIDAKMDYVWPYYKGDLMGESINPLHKNQHLAALKDGVLYQKLALVDALRLRNPRETEIAIGRLRKLIFE